MYINEVLHHYDENGYKIQGEYTLPGYKTQKLNHEVKNLMKAEVINEEEDDGFAATSIKCAILVWYKNTHFIIRREGNLIGLSWTDGKRIESNKFGYYPESKVFCKEKHIRSAIQMARRYIKRYL